MVRGTESGNGINCELNLVPFIDLLSALVMFLLVTAVWVQISVIPTAVKGHAAAVTTVEEGEKRLMVRLTPAGYQVNFPTATQKAPVLIAKVGNNFDAERLTQTIKDIAKSDAAVGADDDVGYGEVIQTIDLVKANGFPTVGLNTN